MALNVAAHGGLLGFLYSWAGVALGGIIMFLFWRRLIKRFFWKVASRSPKLEKAQQWVNRFDTSSLFMLSLLPFTPTSFMHFAFGMSDFDEKRYLRAVLLGKGLMVAMMVPVSEQKEADKAAKQLERVEKVAHMKEVKHQVKENAQKQAENMDAYVVLSFDTYEAKAAFCERFGYDPDMKFIKGEVFDEQVEK